MNPILIIIYVIVVPIVSCIIGRDVYQGPVDPPLFSGQWKGGNKRSATLVGLFFGLCWPLTLAVGILIVIATLISDWVAKGAAK